MPSLWQLLFHIASCESADRNWSSEAMAQIQPNPKWLDAPQSIRPRGDCLTVLTILERRLR